MASRTRSDRQVRLGRIVGLVFCVAGFVVITIAWNGMASVACVDCQLPYLISGGATGLGLILFGGTLLVTASIRAERLSQDARFQELSRQLSLMGAAVETQGSPDGRVVAGKSTYHRPDCRLVKGRQDLDLITVTMAAGQGLSACRVCGPEAPPAAPEAATPGEASAAR